MAEAMRVVIDVPQQRGRGNECRDSSAADAVSAVEEAAQQLDIGRECSARGGTAARQRQ